MYGWSLRRRVYCWGWPGCLRGLPTLRVVVRLGNTFPNPCSRSVHTFKTHLWLELRAIVSFLNFPDSDPYVQGDFSLSSRWRGDITGWCQYFSFSIIYLMFPFTPSNVSQVICYPSKHSYSLAYCSPTFPSPLQYLSLIYACPPPPLNTFEQL